MKKTHKPAMHLMKKMLKKLHASSKSSNTSVGCDAADSVSTKKIFPKVGFLLLDLLRAKIEYKIILVSLS